MDKTLEDERGGDVVMVDKGAIKEDDKVEDVDQNKTVAQKESADDKNGLDKDKAVEEENSDDEDDSESDEDEEVEAPEPLATTRSRRANAGNRMGHLIQEEEDEFYTNIYGGFLEEEDDIDFDSDQGDDEEVENDYDVDSDFSIDETDEIAPEHQAVDDEPSKKKKSAYKDPKPKLPTTSHFGPSSSTPVQPKTKPSSSTTQQSVGRLKPERSFRDSTRKKTAETIKNIETGSKRKKKFRNLEPQRKLTQEELLEEAKLTEEENIKSLEIYQRLESEKLKKIKLIKKTIPVPYVSFYSSIFTNPETKERYSRNLYTYVGCETQVKKPRNTLASKT